MKTKQTRTQVPANVDRVIVNGEVKADSLNKDGDLLSMDFINSLMHPLTAVQYGDDYGWELIMICVETGCSHLDVCGKTDLAHVSDFSKIIDGDGNEYDIDMFYTDYIPEPTKEAN